MRLLILGGNGMLGHKLVQVLGARHDVWTTIRSSFADVDRFGIFDRDRIIENVDVTDLASVRRAIKTARPDVIINAAGVIKQLPTSDDVINTLSINSIFPHHLAQMSDEFGFRLICISTDCVFDGKRGNYAETDEANALDLYGRSKNLGEITSGNAVTLRTSIIGRELGTAHSLVEWLLTSRGGKVKGYANAIYSGFPTVVFADIIESLIVEHADLRGLYHVSSGPVSKYDLLVSINKYFDTGVEIERFEDFRIDRSLDSGKFREATGFKPQPWNEMIALMASDAAAKSYKK